MQVYDERISESNFPWVNNNFLDATTGNITNGTVEYHVKEIPYPNGDGVDSVKVCFFGTGYDYRRSLSRDTHLMDHKEAIPASNETVVKLRADGCQVVIAITH